MPSPRRSVCIRGAGSFARTASRPGTFIAAVGADNPQKSEIRPDLMPRATVVTDILGQCATMAIWTTPSGPGT